jgi:hypothetical protein
MNPICEYHLWYLLFTLYKTTKHYLETLFPRLIPYKQISLLMIEKILLLELEVVDVADSTILAVRG